VNEERSTGPFAPVPALIVMHSDLAAAIVGAVQAVYGSTEGLEPLSNRDLSRDSLQAAIDERVAQWPGGGLVCVDFFGGSCHVAAACVARRRDIVVVTGCHLGMLLDFMHHRATLDKDALAERLVRRGRDTMQVVKGARD
jgi:mannose/fructose-specific phosphotransferase system component IIA